MDINHSTKNVPLPRRSDRAENVAKNQLRPKGVPAVSSSDVPNTTQSGGVNR